MNVDTERVITEVRLRPLLWDQTCELYKDRDAKVKAWLEVCQATIQGFDCLSVSEQKVIEKQVQQRWKTARDAYVRCKATLKNTKSGSQGGNKKKYKYVYFDRMRFLDKNKEVDTEDSISESQSAINESHANSGPAVTDAEEGSLSSSAKLNVDTERVIAEVRLRPLLWDQTCELYKDRDAKIKAWLEVCQATLQGFDCLSESEKKVIEKQVQQRWKTARDAYIRCKGTLKNRKSGTGSENKKKYVYFDCMHFLDKKKGVDSEDWNFLAIQNTINESQANSGQATIDAEDGFLSNPSSYKREINDNELRLASSSKTKELETSQSNQNVHRKRKLTSDEDNTLEREMLNIFKENTKLMQNDDMSFFCSLLPIMQIFSSRQKLLFRSEVLKKAIEISNNCNSIEGGSGPSRSFTTLSESQQSDLATLYSTDELIYVKEEADC